MVKWAMWQRVIRRAVILYAIDLFLSNGNPFGTWRIPGVLAYFSISYFVTAATVFVVNPFTQVAASAAEGLLVPNHSSTSPHTSRLDSRTLRL